MYYPASDQTTLLMGAATSSPLPAPGADVFTEVGLLRTLQPPPVEQSAGSFRVLNDNNPRSVGGRQVDMEYTGTVAIDRNDAGFQMRADAKVAGGRKRNWRVVYPDGSVEDFVGFCRRYAPTQLNADEESAPHEAEFAIRVDGAITES